MLDAFVDAGGTFVDTADVYGDGTSEETLAPWLARRRDDVVLATKLRFEVSDPGGAGLAPERIPRACDASLRRLGVDVIDLYQVHAPDPDVDAGRDAAGARRARARREGARAGGLELPGLAAGLGGRAAGRRGLRAVRLAAAAVLAGRALDRGRDAALLPCGRPRRAALGPARRRLPDRALPPRRAAARRQPHGRRLRRPRGGARAARDRAQLPRGRRGPGGRGRARRDGPPGGAGLAAGPAGRDGADHRPAHPRAPAGPAAGRRPAPVRRAGRASRPPHRAAREPTPSGCSPSRSGSTWRSSRSAAAEAPRAGAPACKRSCKEQDFPL